MEPAETEIGERYPSELSSACQEPFHSFSLVLSSSHCRSLGTLHERLRSFSRRLLIYYEQSISLGCKVPYFYSLIVAQSEYVLCGHESLLLFIHFCPMARAHVCASPSHLCTAVSTTQEHFNQTGLMRWTRKLFGKGTLISMCVLNLLKLIKKLIKHWTI